MAKLPDGVQLSKVNPKYLHSNSTSHVWAFGAFAELIDNAYDPDVGATSLVIDVREIGSEQCLIILDNGAGIDKEKLIKMLSFGYCDKEIYNTRGSYKAVGLYGNGFKSGSMRLGKDALVFSRCSKSACIGFLSQTYLKAIGADSVIVPILEYSLPDLKRSNSHQCRNNLEAILKYSIFKNEASLKEELKSLESSVTGTKIFIFNLHKLQNGREELDFISDRKDIRCPDPYVADTKNVDSRPVDNTPEYKRSLREYCSILYLRPRMKIIIRGQPVKSKYISKQLCETENQTYKPSWMGKGDKPIKITIGFSCEMDGSENYGLMLYHNNRLMRAYDRVGYQKQANEKGVGVIGVVELDFITPTHNKQDFDRNDHFNSIMAALALKLNAYWNSKKEKQNNDVDKLPDWTWAQCDNCLMWRRMPPGIDAESLPKNWFCHMNKDAQYNRCFEEEEPEAPVDNTRQKRAKKNSNIEQPSESNEDEESSTDNEPNPKRKRMATRIPATRSKSAIMTQAKNAPANSQIPKSSQKSPSQKSPSQKSSKSEISAKSANLRVSNKSKTFSEETSQKSPLQRIQRNLAADVDEDDDDDDDDFEIISSGSFREFEQKSPISPKSSPPTLKVSKSLFNVNKSSAKKQNNSDDNQGNDQSTVALVTDQAHIRTRGNVVDTGNQTDAKIVHVAEIQTDSTFHHNVNTLEAEIQTDNTFHQDVRTLIQKVLPETDVDDITDIESFVSLMVREDTPGYSEDLQDYFDQ